MAFTVVEVDDATKALLLATEESHTADLKSLDITPGKLTNTLSAFANAEGGELFIGIDEHKPTGTRTWRGFANVEQANGHVQALEAAFPLGQFVDYQFLRFNAAPGDGLVLKVSVLKTPDVRSTSGGKVFVRRGAQNLPVTDQAALQRLEYLKGVSSFETHPVDTPVELVSDSLVVTGFLMEVVPTVEAAGLWLRKQLLVRDGKPTVAAILLFADEPQAALPKATVKVYRYATSDPEGSRTNLQGQPIAIEGPAYDVIREAVRTAVDTVQGIRIMGPTGMEEISYPEVTLHEIITNAVLTATTALPMTSTCVSSTTASK